MKSFIKSLGYALVGLGLAFKSERNLKIQIAAAVTAVAAGIYLGLTSIEWVLVTLAIGFVLCAELFNTALERMGNEVAAGRQRFLIKTAKDISAGAVLIAALTAFVIGLILLIIPLIKKLSG